MGLYAHGISHSSSYPDMYKIVFMRHGESTWNLENRFTGWTDVDLTEKGIAEARQAGRVLKEAGFTFDLT